MGALRGRAWGCSAGPGPGRVAGQRPGPGARRGHLARPGYCTAGGKLLLGEEGKDVALATRERPGGGAAGRAAGGCPALCPARGGTAGGPSRA